MFLKRILCLFNRHTPKRSTAHWDGVSYIGECRHCGHAIRRRSRGNWKMDTGAEPPVSPVKSSDPRSSG